MKKILISTIAAGLIAGSAQAAWQKVDDFESYADTAALKAVWMEDMDPDGNGGGPFLVTDPYNAGNKVLQHRQGVTTEPNGTGTYNNRTWRTIPPIVSGKATFYLRFAVPNVVVGNATLPGVVDDVWGLTPVDVPTGYGDYSVLSRIEFDGSFDVYDTTTYSVQQTTMPGATWYEFWYVLDHSTRTFNVWIKGGTAYPTKTKLTLINNPGGYRNATIEALDVFLITSSAGTLIAPKGLDAMLYDDLYVDLAGENTSSPIDNGILSNIATRGVVGTGGDILIGGFVIENGPRTVLIRGVGPKLTGFGVAGALADPVIELFRSVNGVSTSVATNDNWGSTDAAGITAAAAAAGAFALDSGSADSALLLNLQPGVYSVQMRGKGTATGVGLIEIYGAK